MQHQKAAIHGTMQELKLTITVVASIRPVAGQADYLSKLLEQLIQDVRAEPGNVCFDAYVETDGNKIVIFEQYRDEAAFKAHIAMPHTTAFNAILTDIAEGGASQVDILKPFGA
ncbi:putative quinol monooxygenase [Paracoccus indicus]|uniref:putative quinol monooxygenase n=1 Tax=Paracoccus indicus TaxID=2079229 RepID=UPI0013B46E09|nr:putative quinol monooxygenase [Paracoccus indicus]